MKDDLLKLLNAQGFDLKSDKLMKDKNEYPDLIEALKKEIEDVKYKHSEIEARHTEIEKTRRDIEAEIDAERELLAGLDGSCRTPIAALAEFADGGIRLRALIARTDGDGMLETERFGADADAEAMGRDAADELRRRAGPDYFTD